MRDCLDFYVDGAWVKPLAGSHVLDVINPANETVSGRVAMGGADDAIRAIEAAARAFPAWAGTPLSRRIELLEAVTALFERRLDEFADAVTEEMGAPFERLAKPAQARAGLGHFKTALALAKTYAFERKQGPTLVVKEPVGVVSLITPWNWPLNQIACKVAPALVTGCAMVLKPSEFAPYSARILAEIIHEAGVPAGVFNMIFGEGPEIGPVLSSHPLVDMVSLTGSNAAGSSVMREASATVKKVSLELGGKSANLILPSADFKRAVGHGVKTMMGNSGQSCNAPSRMFVPAERLEEAEALAAEMAGAIKVGDPRDPETVMGAHRQCPPVRAGAVADPQGGGGGGQAGGRRCRAARRSGDRLFRPSHRVQPCHRFHDHRPSGDLRPRPLHPPLRRSGRRHPGRQRLRLWPVRLCLRRRSRRGPRGSASSAHRHGPFERRAVPSRWPLRRHQAIGCWARMGRGRIR